MAGNEDPARIARLGLASASRSDSLPVHALVRWTNGNDEVGVIVGRESGGGVLVQFDDGAKHAFASGTDALERLVFPDGSQVEVGPERTRGTVIGALKVQGRHAYEIQLLDGSTRRVLEDGVRKAVLENPAALLRAGELDETRATNLRVAATRLAFAHESDELSSLSNSRVEIKPHQVGVVHRVMSQWPHRFLLADEVGLGKTIEAGLIIKELKARGLAERVLILAPSGLVHQWQFEMKTKFNETFARYTREVLNYLREAEGSENPWAEKHNVIASTTFASWDKDRQREIALAGWDLVVIDEAHHARRSWRGESKVERTQLYHLAEKLNDPDMGAASSCLFLTATPMQLHTYELYSLVELLDPTLFPNFEEFERHRKSLSGLNRLVEGVGGLALDDAKARDEAGKKAASWLDQPTGKLAEMLKSPDGRNEVKEELLGKHRLSEVMIRNRKAVVGEFQPRVATMWEVDLTAEERAAYEAITEYTRTGFNRARATKQTAIGFLMVTFQKLLASSSRAVTQTMLKRIAKLEGEVAAAVPRGTPDEERIEETEVTEALDGLLGASAYDDIVAECQELEGLVAMLDAIKLDSKAKVLTKRLAQMIAEDSAAERPDPKVIIFTGFINTQLVLAELLEEDWDVHIFNGQLKPGEKDSAVERFREGTGPQVLISTEAGGEGRNFQFCHRMVNYDLPWNPMKVEQRIGRIDRIGQDHTVEIYNLSTRDTVEERVIEVLDKRIGLFEETVGGLDPILGEVERDLTEMFTLAEEEATRRAEEFERRLETRVYEAREAERKRADFIMDTKSYRREDVQKLLDRRGEASNDDLRRFVLGTLDELRCRISPDPHLLGVFDLTLSELFVDLFPQYCKEGRERRVTFDPSVALDYETVEFMAFGHEIVDALVTRARDAKGYRARASARRILSDERSPTRGWFFVYSLQLDGVVGARDLFPVFIDLDGHESAETAAFLLERAAIGRKEDYGSIDLPERDKAFDQASETADLAAIARLTERQADLGEQNNERLHHEQSKLEAFYTYKQRAAEEKLERVRSTFERLSASDDPEVQKIVPVWAKNLENTKALVGQLDAERDRRLGSLVAREHVNAQHSLLSASYVEVFPDAGSLIGESGNKSKRVLRELSAWISAEELARLGGAVQKRRSELEKLAHNHDFDLSTAQLAADRVLQLCESPDDLDVSTRLLAGVAAKYFLLVDDDAHDLREIRGFDDDLAIADAVSAR